MIHRSLAVTTLAMAAWAPRAAAQAAVVWGTTVDARTGSPLGSVTVVLVGTGRTTVTGPPGRFRFAEVGGPVARIAASRPGFVTVVRLVAVDSGPVRIALESAGSGAVLAAPSELAIRPTATVLDLLGSGIPGVVLTRAGGEVGVGGRIRIRGASSLLLPIDPLVYVDGIRVNGEGATASQAFAGTKASPSRIDDFDPAEVESIEVLRGPAAAAIYGGEAANGVILLTTKRAAPGRAAFALETASGADWLADPEGRFAPNYYVSRSGEIRSFDVLRFNHDRGFPDVFSTGVPLSAVGSLSGGSDRFRYYLDAGAHRDEGYLDYNWRNRYGGRANLSYASSNHALEIDLDLGVRHARTSSASGVQPIMASIIWACNFPWCEPDSGADSATTGWNGPGHGYQFYRPEDYQMVAAFDRVTRTTGNVTLRHRATGWFRQRLTVGPDLTRTDDSVEVAADPTNRNPFFAANGTRSASRISATLLSIDYAADFDWRLGRSLTAGTTLGGQRYSTKRELEATTGIPGTLTGPSVLQSFQRKDQGGYLRQAFAWRDRVFLTAALRVEDDKLGDQSLGTRYEPSVNASWLAADHRAGPGAFAVSELRLRAGWGRVGRVPFELPFDSRPGLEPESTREWEAGIDASLFDDRLGASATWYDRRVTNALIRGVLPPSQGFPGTGLFNGAELATSGVELTLGAVPIRSRSARLDLRFTLTTDRSRIDELSGPPQVSQSSAFQAHVAGFAPGSFFFKRIVHATLTTTTAGPFSIPGATDLQCEGGVDYDLGNGTTVPCASAPRLYAGRPTPSWTGSASATLTLGGRLRLFGLVDYRGGNTVVVGDVAASHSFFLNSKATLDGSDPIVVGYRVLDQGSIGPLGLFKAGFARLRTVSIGYDLPSRVARVMRASTGSIVISFDNLAILWREQSDRFGVGWIDPEVVPNSPNGAVGVGAPNGTADAAGLGAYTQDPFPQPVRVRVSLRLGF